MEEEQKQKQIFFSNNNSINPIAIKTLLLSWNKWINDRTNIMKYSQSQDRWIFAFNQNVH